ncbi:MAG: YhgE/Pip domain-containing protein [Microlunatus sp.]
MWKLERAQDPKVGWLSLVGLILVPLLVSGGFLWATWDSDSRLGRVQAAIVNNDEGVTLNKQFVPLGRQLAGGLVNGEDDVANFEWVLTDDEDARQGLSNGMYAAVVIIPENFSKQATSFSKDDVADIEPAEIAVQTSEVSGITDGVVAQVITTAARETLNTELTKQYLDNIYLGFNTTKKQFRSVADGARKLADGAGGLSDGLDQVSAGSVKLADGLEQLDDGTQQLSTGMTKLADGTKELPTQTRQLADGAEQAADGADELADGVKQFTGGLTQLNEGTKKVPGFGEFADGAGKFAEGAGQYGTLGSGVGQGVQQVSAAMDGFKDLSPGELVKQVPCPFGDDPTTEQCQGFYAGFIGGTQAAHTALTTKQSAPDGKSYSLVDLSKQLESGGEQLSANGPLIAKGLDGYAGGIDKLADNGPKLAKGTSQLASGLDQLADGTDKLATGLKQLSGGIQQTAAGTKQLATGTSQSATGGRQLSDGLVKLADGGSQLADGSDQLATGLEKGAKQIPTYDKQMRTALSSVVATPVTAERPASLFADIANTTLLSVLALWLGGLASFVVLRAIPSRVLTSMKPSWWLAGEALLPAVGVAVIQAIAMTITLQNLLKLDAGQVAQLLPFLLLAGLSFVAVNHALVAWLGGVGRFISVGVVVLSVATAITHAIPEFLSGIVPFLPLTPAMEGARAIASGGPGVGGSVGLLLAWLLMGVAAGVLAVARHRVARVPELVPVPA